MLSDGASPATDARLGDESICFWRPTMVHRERFYPAHIGNQRQHPVSPRPSTLKLGPASLVVKPPCWLSGREELLDRRATRRTSQGLRQCWPEGPLLLGQVFKRWLHTVGTMPGWRHLHREASLHRQHPPAAYHVHPPASDLAALGCYLWACQGRRRAG